MVLRNVEARDHEAVRLLKGSDGGGMGKQASAVR